MQFSRTRITPTLLRQSWKCWIGMELRSAGPAWLEWVWTLLFAAAIALAFTVAGMALNAGRISNFVDPALWGRWYRVNFVIALSVAVSIHLLLVGLIPLVGVERIQSFTRRGRAVFFSAVPLLGVIVGWPLGVWLVGQDAAGWVRIDNPRALVGSAVVALLISAIIFLVFNAKARQLEAEKRATESQLLVLQAQMEPHFLFNTLANVQTLIEVEPARARQLLESFTDYLRATLSSLRREQTTLRAELDLARAYLSLLQARMEDRLHFEIDADEAARQALLPPLLLQPLIENAVLHGLEPKLEGGTVQVSARVDGGELHLRVADDGLGLDATAGARRSSGVALSNLRERLAAAYGDSARLDLAGASPGTVATLVLPYHRSTA